MDKRTLKSVIVELKNLGMTFNDIADTLLNDYDVKMSRQAVCGMYNRIIKSSKTMLLSTSDVVNYHSIGLNNHRIKELLSLQETELTLVDIQQTLKENEDFIASVNNQHLELVKKFIIKGSDMEDIKMALEYKGQRPTDSVINKLLELGSHSLIERYATNILARTYSINDDRKMMKDTISKFGFNISLRDIGKVLNS